MKKNTAAVIITAVSALFLVTITCDNGNDPLDEKRVITLLSPTGGSGVTFSVDDTVRIRWTVNNSYPDSAKFANVAIVGSTNGGTSWAVPISGSNPVPPDTPVWTGSYLWTIGSECASSQFVLKLYDYLSGSLATDKSSPFVVNSNP